MEGGQDGGGVVGVGKGTETQWTEAAFRGSDGRRVDRGVERWMVQVDRVERRIPRRLSILESADRTGHGGAVASAWRG